MHTHGKTLKKKDIDPSILKSWSISQFEKHKCEFYTASYDGNMDNLKINAVKYEKTSKYIWISDKPFAKGGLRYAFAAHLLFN